MGFAFFFLISYLITYLFLVMKKKLSIIENTFVFLLILMLNINATWILFEELNLISVTEEAMEYFGFLLNRSIIFPMIIVVYLNIVKRSHKKTHTILITIASISTMLTLSGISILLNMITFVTWNFLYDAIYIGLCHLIAFYSLKLFIKSAYRGVNYS